MVNLKGTEKQIAWAEKIIEGVKKDFVRGLAFPATCYYRNINFDNFCKFLDSLDDAKKIIEMRNLFSNFIEAYRYELRIENYETSRNIMFSNINIVTRMINYMLNPNKNLSIAITNMMSDLLNKCDYDKFLFELKEFINYNFCIENYDKKEFKKNFEEDLEEIVYSYYYDLETAEKVETAKTAKTTKVVEVSESRKDTISRIKAYKKTLKISKTFTKSEIENFISTLQNAQYKTVQTEITNLRRLAK